VICKSSESFFGPKPDMEDLDQHLMSFVNVLGVVIFLLIASFHYVQAAARNQS